ncbi:hypothetical protein GGU11DRAFT_522316 [Lentinula aff. detonsa]|nr:hypothetical protein GGU11DRAFT_522316 [Lentinula aff. detonsa]
MFPRLPSLGSRTAMTLLCSWWSLSNNATFPSCMRFPRWWPQSASISNVRRRSSSTTSKILCLKVDSSNQQNIFVAIVALGPARLDLYGALVHILQHGECMNRKLLLLFIPLSISCMMIMSVEVLVIV